MKILTFLLIFAISEALCDVWPKGLCQGIHMGATPCEKIYINDDHIMSCRHKCLKSCYDSQNEGCRWVSYDTVNYVCHKHKTCRTTYNVKLFDHYSYFDIKKYDPSTYVYVHIL